MTAKSKGTFYDKELQKVIKHDDMCEVEKILKKQGKGENVQYLVKWSGYPDKTTFELFSFYLLRYSRHEWNTFLSQAT